jgi:hypothetical protein
MEVVLFTIGMAIVGMLMVYIPLKFLFPSLFAPKVHCHTCGKDGKGIRQLAGNAGVELLLWLFFLVPGLFYSIWRHSDKTYRCPHCQATQGVERIDKAA